MRIAVGCTLACLVICSPSYALRTYHVGNSLTHSINSAGLANWVASRGGSHPYGYHIKNNAKLEDIWNTPSSADSSVVPYGPHGNALPNYEWDAVTLEPFSTNTTDAARIADFVGATLSNSANSDTQFYLYESWPWQWDFYQTTYSAFWEQPWTGSGTSTTVRTRDYFQRLTDQVNSMSLGLEKDVLLVPVGDVMNELDKRMRAGDIPGFSSILDIYVFWHNIHLEEGQGAFVVSSTFYATLYQDNPMGLAIPSSMTSSVTPEFAAAVQRVVWDVVAGHPYSGVPEAVVGDFDGDSQVTAADYEVWKSTFGSKSDLRADANLDFVVDAADYTVWRDQMSTMGSGAASVPVPQPVGTMIFATAAAMLFAASRRRYFRDRA